ncbi:MAG: hypothetical protein ACHQFX_15530 [Chitinophagales bacterium]
MLQEDPITTLATQLEITLGGNDFTTNKKMLAERINVLIQNDFQKLISILYRLDVSEEKLKFLLKENIESDAGVIITDLIIERQMQKIKSRQQFSQRDDNIDDSEKW